MRKGVVSNEEEKGKGEFHAAVYMASTCTASIKTREMGGINTRGSRVHIPVISMMTKQRKRSSQ